jgi:hypothetical protein
MKQPEISEIQMYYHFLIKIKYYVPTESINQTWFLFLLNVLHIILDNILSDLICRCIQKRLY